MKNMQIFYVNPYLFMMIENYAENLNIDQNPTYTLYTLAIQKSAPTTNVYSYIKVRKTSDTFFLLFFDLFLYPNLLNKDTDIQVILKVTWFYYVTYFYRAYTKYIWIQHLHIVEFLSSFLDILIVLGVLFSFVVIKYADNNTLIWKTVTRPIFITF